MTLIKTELLVRLNYPGEEENFHLTTTTVLQT